MLLWVLQLITTVSPTMKQPLQLCRSLTLHPVLLHVLDLCDALSEVGGEASSVLLARSREDDQHLPLSSRIGGGQSDTVRIVWVTHTHTHTHFTTSVTHFDLAGKLLLHHSGPESRWDEKENDVAAILNIRNTVLLMSLNERARLLAVSHTEWNQSWHQILFPSTSLCSDFELACN